jgi:hypothetical protein
LYVGLTLVFELWVIYYMSASENRMLGGPCEESMRTATSMGYTRKVRRDIKWFTVGFMAVTVGQLVYMVFVPARTEQVIAKRKKNCCVVLVRWVVLAVGTTIWGMFIVFNELMIVANQVGGEERDWSYGQMLAVSMLLSPILECIGGMIGNRWQWRRPVNMDIEMQPVVNGGLSRES